MFSLLTLLVLPPAASAEDGEAASEDVVVEAERIAGRETWDTPAAVSIFEIDERLRPGVDLGTLIDQAPGVHLQSFGDQDDFQGVHIRGSSMRQVQIYMDGIPLNPEGGEAVNLSEWPVRALERVEVYRGYAPADLGGAAIGGAIDLVPRAEGVPFSGGLSAGSFHRYGADAYLGRAAGTQELSLFAQGHSAAGDYPYFTDNGTPYVLTDDRRLARANNQSEQASALGRARWRIGRTVLTLIDAFLWRDEGMPGHVNNPSTTASMETRRNLLGLKAQRSQGDHHLSLASWWLQRTSRYDDRDDELGLGSQWEAQRARHLGLRVHDRWFVTGAQSLGLAGSVRSESGSTEDLRTSAAPDVQSRTVETLTADAEIFVGPLGATPVIHTTFLQGDAPQTSVDPRLGLRWRWGEDLVLRATGGRYLRPPDLTELFGDRGSMLGNPDLRPEQGWQWDVGGRGRWSPALDTRLQADVGHFWSVSTDRIIWVQNSQRTMIPLNLGRSWVQGLEGSLMVDTALGLASDTSLSFTRSRNLDRDPSVANKQLPGVPTWAIWEELSWSLRGGMIRLATDYRFTDGTYWDATNWYRSAPRSIHGASVQIQPRERWPRVELGVSNLLDTQAEVVPQNPLQPDTSERVAQPLTDFAGHPLPGRSFTVNIRWESGGAS